MALFEIKDLSFSYPESDEKVLNGLSLTIEKGDFIVIFGRSGCGKSTFLSLLKPVTAPKGKISGEIFYKNSPLTELDKRTQAAEIGFVGQSPENQIVTDKVWHELAFGLEGLGLSNPEIRRKTAEMAAFFGIEKWFHMETSSLSGGQKQILNLASVMVLEPDVLILDEPTSQLDPIAASEFFSMLKKINSELGVAIILTEHRLEEALPLADRAAFMKNGKLLFDGSTSEAGTFLTNHDPAMFMAMPVPTRIWSAVEPRGKAPLTAAEGRKWLEGFAASNKLNELPKRAVPTRSEIAAVEVSEAWFRYEKDGADIVKGLDLTVYKGEIFALLGGNGAGKTTLLRLISGLKKPYKGKLRLNGTLAVLPQDPQTLFVKNTVIGELKDMLSGREMTPDKDEKKLSNVVKLCRLGHLLERHPYDLSGGERQRAALAKVLLCDPEILLLDEPTKGFDAEFKLLFGRILDTLVNSGKTLIMVSHDVEFCAEHAHRCAMFFDGIITSEGTASEFFCGNSFYTTSANRMARKLIPEAVTAADVIEACGGKNDALPDDDNSDFLLPKEKIDIEKKEKLPLWRRIFSLIFGLAVLVLFVNCIRVTDLSEMIASSELTPLGSRQMKLYGAFLISLFAFGISICRSSKRVKKRGFSAERKKLPKRTAIACIAVLLLVPITLAASVHFGVVQRYYLISVILLTECMLPFLIAFEGKKPGAGEIVLIASLAALGIAGRAVFFMLPQFKPVAALTIISGIALGGESGFLVGAVTMLASNIMFSQGPWTPFQMFAMGMIGFAAGLLFHKGFLSPSRGVICIFGAIAVVLIYGGIMDPVAALIWSGETLNAKMLLTYYASGLPMDIIHASATALFLWFGAEPMLEKLERLTTKYDLYS